MSDEGGAPYDAGRDAPTDDQTDARTDGGRETQQEARWDGERVRDLRARLGLTQAGLADRLGTRQQTVSEWETGSSSPRRMSRRLLRMVAEDAGLYDARAPGLDHEDDRPEGGAAS